MIDLLAWYVIISLVGLIVFPLTYRLLPGLADRGYAFSRTLGLLVWGFIFWLLGSLGILLNDLPGQFLALAVVISLSVWAARGLDFHELRMWLRAHINLLLIQEALFLLALAGLALMRSADPVIAGTEKPMELAFINANLLSPELPPHDPWLSGFAISYYYFGYVLVAMLARVASTPGGVAFNLGISLTFALSALGAYGLVYNLLQVRIAKRRGDGDVENRHDREDGARPRATPKNPLALTQAFLGPLFLLLVSNLEGFLHVLHTRGIFWTREAGGGWSSAFWKWLDIIDLNRPPDEPFSWIPTRFWWWWRASRVLQDYDFLGNSKEIIDEFPFFSYLLADLHPHVLAMPFALLAIALALNLYLGGASGHFRWLGIRLQLCWPAFWLAAVVIGGMAFLNIWDFPVYVVLFAGAYALFLLADRNKSQTDESLWRDDEQPSFFKAAGDFLGLGIALGASGILLYLPFHLSFSSQAGGFLPSLVYFTRGAHFWVMFGPLLVPNFAFLWFLTRSESRSAGMGRGFLMSLAVILALSLLSLLLVAVIANLSGLAGGLPAAQDAAAIFLGSMGAPDWGPALREALSHRLIAPGAWITLLALLSLSMGLIFAHRRRMVQPEAGALQAEPADVRQAARSAVEPSGVRSGGGPETYSLPSHPPGLEPLLRRPGGHDPSHVFFALLVTLGALLALVPEFVYLRDQFGWRMNTIFKFYYQVWILWGLAAAYGTAVLLAELRGVQATIFRSGLVLLMAMALVYPVLSSWSKTDGFADPQTWTLDGTAHLKDNSPDEQAAMLWLKEAPLGVVVEAVGGSYSPQGHARMSTNSGQPNVLGWTGHESQWRGGDGLFRSRPGDVERLYCTTSWDETQAILDQYHIRYVVVSALERSTYSPNETTCQAGLNERKFDRRLQLVFQQGMVRIYEVP